MTKTSDDTIKEGVKERLVAPKSFFGKGKGKISRFKKKDKLKLHEL